MDLYDALDLSSDCSQEDIKKQYRKMAKKHHPDHGGDEEKFKNIQLAYDTLSDPEKRKEYDETGRFNHQQDSRSVVITELANLLNHYLQNLDPEEDLIMTMKADITEAIKGCKLGITNANYQITRLEKIKKRIGTHKNENLLAKFVESHIDRYKNSLPGFDKKIEIFEEMSTMLEDYFYGTGDDKELADTMRELLRN